MSHLQNKKIVLGITGSIAAYKCAVLVRLLIKKGAEVKVIMTKASTHFISALTLATLSKNKVAIDIMDDDTWNNHVDLGLWGDYFIIAPASANTISKLANGQSNNMLVATYLSARCPVLVAPAMDVDMWHHASTKQNIDTLKSYGNQIIPVGHGELASGLVGDGRMAEPEEIVSYVEGLLSKSLSLKGKKAIVTAGPTYQAIDPVRFIGNHSSGKMGIAIADELASKGADTTLILGPSHHLPSRPSVNIVRVVSAQDMYEAVEKIHSSANILVMAAAVADYTPAEVADQKIKKKEGDLSISLQRTVDIAATLGKQKHEGQVHVGFALETQNEATNAFKKVQKKNFDFIVLNSMNDAGAGFKHDTNKVTFIDKDNNQENFKLKSKVDVAKDIVSKIESLL